MYFLFRWCFILKSTGRKSCWFARKWKCNTIAGISKGMRPSWFLLVLSRVSVLLAAGVWLYLLWRRHVLQMRTLASIFSRLVVCVSKHFSKTSIVAREPGGGWDIIHRHVSYRGAPRDTASKVDEMGRPQSEEVACAGLSMAEIAATFLLNSEHWLYVVKRTKDHAEHCLWK